LGTFFPFVYHFDHVVLEADGGVHSAIYFVTLMRKRKEIE
jgi:hypothetical protein